MQSYLSYQPTPGFLLVQIIPTKHMSESGLFLPPSADDQPTEGIVRAVGGPVPDNVGGYIDPPCRVGDVVNFARGTGMPLAKGRFGHPGHFFRVFGFNEVYGVISPQYAADIMQITEDDEDGPGQCAAVVPALEIISTTFTPAKNPAEATKQAVDALQEAHKLVQQKLNWPECLIPAVDGEDASATTSAKG